MLKEDGLSSLCSDERGGLVTIGKVEVDLPRLLIDLMRPVGSLCVDGHEVVEPVAAMDVQQLTVRSEAMRRIDITAVVAVEVEPPVVPVLCPEVFKVMKIGAFHMKHLTEQSALRHLQTSHLEKVIDAVLKHHTVLARPLGSIDERPDVLHRCGRRDFDGNMLPVFHCKEGDGHMMHPVGANIDDVDVVALAHLFIGFYITEIGGSLMTAMTLQYLLCAVDTTFLNIAEGHNVGALNLTPPLNGPWPAHPKADEGHANGVKGGCRQFEDVLLALGFRRCVDGQLSLTEHGDSYCQTREKESFHCVHFLF